MPSQRDGKRKSPLEARWGGNGQWSWRATDSAGNLWLVHIGNTAYSVLVHYTTLVHSVPSWGSLQAIKSGRTGVAGIREGLFDCNPLLPFPGLPHRKLVDVPTSWTPGNGLQYTTLHYTARVSHRSPILSRPLSCLSYRVLRTRPSVYLVLTLDYYFGPCLSHHARPWAMLPTLPWLVIMIPCPTGTSPRLHPNMLHCLCNHQAALALLVLLLVHVTSGHQAMADTCTGTTKQASSHHRSEIQWMAIGTWQVCGQRLPTTRPRLQVCGVDVGERDYPRARCLGLLCSAAVRNFKATAAPEQPALTDQDRHWCPIFPPLAYGTQRRHHLNDAVSSSVPTSFLCARSR